MATRQHDQLNLPPTLLTNGSHKVEVRTERSQTPEDLSAVLFAGAMDAAHLTVKEAAGHAKVSESLVRRWRSPHHREVPSHVQLLMMPPAFQLAYSRGHSRHFGFAQQALLRLGEALGDIVVLATDDVGRTA
jgi:hypothetical protein